MYLDHFGFREPPFGLTPDTSFFFACSGYQEALNTLLIAARNGEGFIKIIGEVGYGKTLLCRKFLTLLNQGQQTTTLIGTQNLTVEELTGPTKPRFVTAYIPNPYLEPHSLLLALAEEFRVPMEKDIDQHLLLKGLKLALLKFAGNGQRALVCLDEAQAMPLESLEVLRLLTNLETEKRKLLQVILFGQPELDDRLRHHAIRQLRQRISFQYVLKGLTRDELDRYLRHRVSIAGYKGETLFTRGAVAKLHRITAGTPRLVNIVAHKALMVAFGEGQHEVTDAHVAFAAADTPEVRRDWLPWLIVSTSVVVFMVLVFAVWRAMR